MCTSFAMWARSDVGGARTIEAPVSSSTAPENPKAATYAEMEAVKLGVTEALAPHASGYLLDPEFGVAPTINRFVLPGRTGLLVALEQSGYEKKGNWRLTTLLDGWSVEKVK